MDNNKDVLREALRKAREDHARLEASSKLRTLLEKGEILHSVLQKIEETYIKEEKVEEDIRVNITDHFFITMRKTGMNDTQITRVAQMGGFGLESPFSGKRGIFFKKTVDPAYFPLPPSRDSPWEPDYDSATPPQRPSSVVDNVSPLPPTEKIVDITSLPPTGNIVGQSEGKLDPGPPKG